jgi:hypothetical protein
VWQGAVSQEINTSRHVIRAVEIREEIIEHEIYNWRFNNFMKVTNKTP